ncbi:MAG: hypothetical protein B6I30_06645 [Desulfobacteraceae bacterium 4572_187]|nr:MAG: hypothetical protein B6I30_06645 [Desulfobacteraceae bacterium 4572_187]
MRTKKHNERCSDCKANIKNLLHEIFGNVKTNYDINLPSKLEDYSGTNIIHDLSPIFRALKKNRGFDSFVKAKKLPRVDFFIPEKQIIVEFDESQHFTNPRDITLSLYPPKKEYGFSITRWRTLCQKLNKRDNDPPYRDEQRAWYDTLRDFAPLIWGVGKTVRIFASDFTWCSFNSKKDNDLKMFKQYILAQEMKE